MKILIVEDEPIIARRIKRILSEKLARNITQISICHSLEAGLDYLAEHEIDVLFLDLNLNGENGFDILESVVSASFHTIIVSANKDKAIKAFEYGVLDFIPKPFNEVRISQALQRMTSLPSPDEQKIKYLAIQKRGRHLLLEVKDLLYIKGAGIYAELHFKNGSTEIHNKNLDKLAQILPSDFVRIHKSYIANMGLLEAFKQEPGSKYTLVLQGDISLPISRTRYKELKDSWAI